MSLLFVAMPFVPRCNKVTSAFTFVYLYIYIYKPTPQENLTSAQENLVDDVRGFSCRTTILVVHFVVLARAPCAAAVQHPRATATGCKQREQNMNHVVNVLVNLVCVSYRRFEVSVFAAAFFFVCLLAKPGSIWQTDFGFVKPLNSI